MAMTRKDFQALADIVAGHSAKSGGVGVEMLAEQLASFCAQQNPRFDRGRFIEACNLPAR